MKFFDYIYFRINEVYLKWDGRNGVTSIIAVSMVQSMLIADILAIILNQSLGKKYLEPYAKVIAIIWFIILVSLVIYNF